LDRPFGALAARLRRTPGAAHDRTGACAPYGGGRARRLRGGLRRGRGLLRERRRARRDRVRDAVERRDGRGRHVRAHLPRDDRDISARLLVGPLVLQRPRRLRVLEPVLRDVGVLLGAAGRSGEPLERVLPVGAVCLGRGVLWPRLVLGRRGRVRLSQLRPVGAPPPPSPSPCVQRPSPSLDGGTFGQRPAAEPGGAGQRPQPGGARQGRPTSARAARGERCPGPCELRGGGPSCAARSRAQAHPRPARRRQSSRHGRAEACSGLGCAQPKRERHAGSLGHSRGRACASSIRGGLHDAFGPAGDGRRSPSDPTLVDAAHHRARRHAFAW
jgi:hypothetical protein